MGGHTIDVIKLDFQVRKLWDSCTFTLLMKMANILNDQPLYTNQHTILCIGFLAVGAVCLGGLIFAHCLIWACIVQVCEPIVYARMALLYFFSADCADK